MVGAAAVQQRSEDLFLSLPAVSLGQRCLMRTGEIGHWVSVVVLLHRDFGADYRVYSQTIPYLTENCYPDLGRALYFGSKATFCLVGRRKTFRGSS